MSHTKRLLVLFGSQTFTAQEIAEKIWRKTKILGFSGPVQAMDDYPINSLIQEEFAIFVCSTAGQGEEPDNMKKFWKFLLKKSLPNNSLVRLKFGVIALGDSYFPKFNWVGKKLHKRLVQLGATPLIDCGLCDNQHDLGHDAVMIPWLNDYWTQLKIYFKDLHTNDLENNFMPRFKVEIIKSDEKLKCEGLNEDIYFKKPTSSSVIVPKKFEIVSNERTTDKSHFQDCRLITLKCADGEIMSYRPGDIFNLRPRNSKEDIDELFDIFRTNGLDIEPHYKICVKKFHEGPERAGVIGGFSGGANTLSSQDDEYRYAGVEDPKIMITTSRDPSARLKMFVKELRLIFPNSQRMNRGGYEMSQLIHACRANEVTDFIVVHEHRGVPDSLVICHLPYGPTASFTLSGVVMRHDIPDIGPMTEQYPHLIFHNFKTELDMPVPEYLQQALPLYEIAEQYWDLKFIPSQYVFTLLSMVSEDKLERDKCLELCSAEGQEEWLNYCRRPRRTILEVLQDFYKSTSKLTIDILFELFSTIKPRAFSIASSSVQTDGQTLDILVAVVNYYSKMKKPRLGLASNWLATLKNTEQIYGWFKPGTFYFPKDVNVPCIMIGPGTGLAPFRGFILDRVALGTASKNSLILVFGCRYEKRDFHCKEQMEELAKKDLITLFCAFSRDQENKIYVQHKLKEQKQLIWSLIKDQQAYVYISGNGKNMPENVKDTFIEDIIADAGIQVEDAKTFIKDMETEGRYQVETW